MPSNVIYLEDERLLRSYDKIGRAIVNYINDMDLSWKVEMARRIYFGRYTDMFDGSKIGAGYKPFIEWLIFSYRIYNGRSLIHCISEGDYINRYEKETLSCLKNTYESLYMVCSVKDNEVCIKDLFDESSITLYDYNLSDSIKRYFGIFARIVNINNSHILIPGYSVMSNYILKETEKYLTQKFMYLNQYHKYTSMHNFIDRNSLMLHRYFLHYQV